MARVQRKRSESGYYHIMVRGNNKEAVFKNEWDNERYGKIGIKTKYRIRTGPGIAG